LFTDAFLHPADRKESLQDAPLFRTAAMPAFFPDKEQQEGIAHIFREMMQEMESGYVHKFDVLRNYLHLLIHQAMKMQPQAPAGQPLSAATRIAQQFLELLERQFPI